MSCILNGTRTGGKKMNKSFFSTRRLVVLGMMIAITFILGYTPIGFIMIPPISITIAHIPTIITALLLGPFEGIIIGISFGIVSLLRAIIAASVIDKLFIDPRLSVLPRLFIGLIAYLAFILIKKLLLRIIKNEKRVDRISLFSGAIFGSLANTAGVLGMLYLLYAQKYIEAFDSTVKQVVLASISINVVVEMIVAAIISTPIVLASRKSINKLMN